MSKIKIKLNYAFERDLRINDDLEINSDHLIHFGNENFHGSIDVLVDQNNSFPSHVTFNLNKNNFINGIYEAYIKDAKLYVNVSGIFKFDVKKQFENLFFENDLKIVIGSGAINGYSLFDDDECTPINFKEKISYTFFNGRRKKDVTYNYYLIDFEIL